MSLLIVATVCARLFAGAAIYINAVEHPARLSCGTELAVREFAPSYHRATLMQVPLARRERTDAAIATPLAIGLRCQSIGSQQHPQLD
jgi:hypothetical protein